MEKQQRNILFGLGGLALFLLSRKSKVNSLSPKYGDWDSSRFQTFDYYSQETQAEIKEQAQKDKQTYFGDNSPLAFYDSFYDYSNSPDQLDILEVAKGGEAFVDISEVSAFRARIVPNSFLFKTYPEYGSSCYVYFLIEIFNPFPFTLNKTRMAQIKDIFLSDMTINGNKCSILDPSLNLYNREAFNTYMEKYNYCNATNPANNTVESYSNFIFGERSVFIPALSVIPNITNTVKTNMGYSMWSNTNKNPCWYRKDEVPYGDDSREEYVLIDPNYDWIYSFGVKLHLQLQASKSFVTDMFITAGNTQDTKFTYSNSGNKSISYQKASYFKWNQSVPIFKRPEVCEVLYPYKSSNLNDYLGAKNGFWESLQLLSYASKNFTSFGELNPLGVLFKN